MTSSGPTTLACILDSLAHGAHSCIQENPSMESNGQIPSSDQRVDILAFRGFGCRKFVHPHILNFHLPKSQNHCLFNYLIWWSSYSTHDLWCRLFQDFGVLGFGAVHLSSLPISQNVDFFLDNQWSRSLLDRILWSNHEFMFHEFSRNHPWLIQVKSQQKVDRSPHVLSDGRSWLIWDFAYRNFHTPVQLQRDLNLVHTF